MTSENRSPVQQIKLRAHMIIRKCLLILALVLTGCKSETPAPETAGPPSTDIWLFDLSGDSVTEIARVTNRDGYDNQPSFTPDGKRILFTSDRTGNMDTFSYDLESGGIEQITSTIEGEYSPTVLPDGRDSLFSVIRMDTTGVQELWVYPLDADVEPRRLADVDRVAYHTWVGEDRILFSRLGATRTLQLITEGTADTTLISPNPAFSPQRVPGQRASSYWVGLGADSSEIRLFDWDSAESTTIVSPLDGQRDFNWTPDGRLVMLNDNELYAYRPGVSTDWELVADLGIQGGTRLAVSPDGRYLAAVGIR
jgi:WD40-like Beta Propeller Repeat